MFPDTIFRFFKADSSSRSRKEEGVKNEVGWIEVNVPCSKPPYKDSQDPCFTRTIRSTRLSLPSDKPLNNRKMNFSNNMGRIRKGEKKLGTKVRNVSELIQRVTHSCLLNTTPSPIHRGSIIDDDMDHHDYYEDSDDVIQDTQTKMFSKNGHIIELEMLIGEVFEAVSNMKGAYISMQQAHCPWDADKMQVADVGVVAELKRLGVLWERFKISGSGGGGVKWSIGVALMKEVVAPYEAAVEGLKREVKTKEMMIVELKEKVKMTTFSGISCGRKTREKPGKPSRRKVCCLSQVAAAPGPELFESTMGLVIDAAKSFTAMLLSLMRSAHWDIVAAVRSIESASISINYAFTATNADSIVGANHSKYALESFVNRKMFQGFDHESFNMDGSLPSSMHPDQYRRACFTLFKDMKDMDPVELVDVFPTCSFGNFCFKKYLTIVHPKMEESLFGDLEQRCQVLDKHHPISKFYGEFLGLAKVVWLLHLLAFSTDPPLSHFEAGRGVEFHPEYMESVVTQNPRGQGGTWHFRGRQVVGFPVSPGFKLGDESVIKARVYLVQNREFQ